MIFPNAKTELERNAARARWLTYLREPWRKKNFANPDRLEDPNNPVARTSLGHACHTLGAVRDSHGEDGDGESAILYDGAYGVLPSSIALLLDINWIGSFVVPTRWGSKTYCSISDLDYEERFSMPMIARFVEIQWAYGNIEPFSPPDLEMPRRPAERWFDCS